LTFWVIYGLYLCMTSTPTEINNLLELKQLQVEELTKKLHSAQLKVTLLQSQVEHLLRRI
jgi:hypothetical protein